MACVNLVGGSGGGGEGGGGLDELLGSAAAEPLVDRVLGLLATTMADEGQSLPAPSKATGDALLRTLLPNTLLHALLYKGDPPSPPAAEA